MNESLIELRKKPHLSVSALKTYLLCPRKYFMIYVERARADYYPAALSLGSAWHIAVGDWLNETADAESIEQQLRNDLGARLRRDDVPVLFDDPDETGESFVNKAVAMFKTFAESVPRPRMVLGTEIAFETAIAHPTTGEVLAVPVIGAVDAIVIDDRGKGALLELKTSARKWPSKGGATEHDPQVTLYRKAARELGYDGIALRILVTTKTAVPMVQTLDIERTDADEEELAELFLEVHRAIKAGTSYRQRGWACSSCPYSGTCRP